MRAAPARCFFAFVLATLTSAVAPIAAADPTPTVTTTSTRESRYWSERWRKVDAVDYTITGVAVAALGVEFYLHTHKQPDARWTEPILFDSDVRDALMMDKGSSREAVETASWAIFLGSVAYPLVVDVPVAWKRGGGQLAWQFFWQDLLVLTTTAAIDLGIRDIVGRTRPGPTECIQKGGSEAECTAGDKESTRSFPNGHFAVGSSMAALICVQHLNTHLYGGPGDAITCASALAANVSMGVMRIMVDAHWATDTIVSGALGALTGWLLPTLLYYRGGSKKLSTDDVAKNSSSTPSMPFAIPMPMLVNGGLGLSFTGAL